MMRWDGRYLGDGSTDLHSPGSDPAPLRAVWAGLITNIRFTGDTGLAADARLPQARLQLKTAARWSRLLNDIPPPTITWNPTTRVATATRSGATGTVYISASADSFPEPVDDYTHPVYVSSSPNKTTYSAGSTEKYFSARVYAPDLDGDAGWSAIFTYKAP